MSYVIEYKSCGKWHLWRYAATRKRALEIIAGRNNPVALCRIRDVGVEKKRRKLSWGSDQND